jgi:5'-deoxynucleotidase YfbR-like HD superfamily hydrolase
MKNENLYAGEGIIRTVTGKYINVFEPTPEMIDLEDIAHALSMQPRFGGHLPYFYSVATHSCMCADAAPEGHKLAALLHDASEAYLLDVPSPIKSRLTNYYEIEDKLMAVIAQKFGFQWPLSDEVKAVDKQNLEAEWECFAINHEQSFDITPAIAKSQFLQKFKMLGL